MDSGKRAVADGSGSAQDGRNRVRKGMGNVHNGEQIAGWHQVRAGGAYSHWMPCDMPPEGVGRIEPEYLRKRIGRQLMRRA